MALAKQLVDVPLTGGLSTKLEGVLVDKARLLRASNLTVNKSGTLARRDAWVGLAGGTGIAPVELATLGSELLAVDGTTNNLYAYSPTAGAVVSRGLVPHFRSQLDSISKSTLGKISVDHASINGLTCYAWIDTSAGGGTPSGLNYALIDESSGARIVANSSISVSSAASTPKVVVVTSGGASHFVVTYVSAVDLVNHGAVISMAAISTAGVVVTTPIVVASDVSLQAVVNTIFFDVAAVATSGGNTYCLLVYRPTAVNTITGMVYDYTGSTVITKTAVAAGGILTGSMKSLTCANFTQTAVGVVFTDSGTNNSRSVVVATSSGAIVPSSAIATGIGASAAVVGACLNPATGALAVVCQPNGGAGTISTWATYALTSSNVAGAVSNPLNCLNTSASAFVGPFLYARPFSSGGTIYVAAAITSTLQTSLYVVDISGNVAASSVYGSRYNDAVAYSTLPNVVTLSSGAISIPVLTQESLSFFDGTNTTRPGVSRVLLSPGRSGTSGPAPLWHAQAANCLYFSGSFLAMYDGATVAEAGFFYFPEGVTATIPASNGSNGIAGSYQVVSIYEWTDNQGQRHQSAPSIPVSVTVTGGAGTSSTGIAMSAPTLQLGVRAKSCSVVFFRTTGNGQTFYRVNSVASPLGNTLSSLTMTYTDTSMVQVSGVDPITANEILYTTSGELPNDNPPPCNAIASYQGRLVFSNAEDGQDWRFSQSPVTGQGLYFNETLLGGRTPQASGAISGLAVLDDKLVIGTATAKLWVSGTGPNSAGLNGSLSSPQLLPSDVGFLDQRSIALVPDVGVDDGPLQAARPGGLVHQTRHGLYLLDRGLVDRAVGFPVDAYASGKTITSAAVLQDRGQLRLTVSGASGASVIVYDYLWGQWETFASTACAPQCGAIWNGLWTSGDASLGLIQDSPGTYLDMGGSPITWTLVTAWLKLASLQGFERLLRVLLFGSYSGPSTLSAAASQDYSTVTAGTLSPILGVTPGFLGGISEATANLTTTDGLRWQVRWHQENQKVEAVQFTITDTPTGGNWGGVSISGLTLELGLKRGTTKKLPAQQST